MAPPMNVVIAISSRDLHRPGANVASMDKTVPARMQEGEARNADPALVEATVLRCPSGALRVRRLDDRSR
jgi:hypothetical protein